MMSRPMMCFVFLFSMVAGAFGQQLPDQEVRTISVMAQKAPEDVTQFRLLPASYELHDRNASVIILRLPYEQTHFMEEVFPKFQDMLERPFDDPTLGEEISFDGFYRELRTAAYCRWADWGYPIDAIPMSAIRLPDANTGRRLVGTGLTLWVRTKIAAQEYDQAREGILVGLAVARHYARTPFLVCQLISKAIVVDLLREIERLMTQPDSPNLYWALTLLPQPFFSTLDTWQWESQFIIRSSERLAAGEPASDDLEAWKTIAEDLIRHSWLLVDNNVKPETEYWKAAREEMRRWPDEWTGITPDVRERISEEEWLVRSLLSVHHRFASRRETASHLPAPQDVIQMAKVQRECDAFLERFPHAVLAGIDVNGFSIHLSLKSLDRKIAMLANIEALRDYASKHGGALPNTLAELTDLPSLPDPITGQAFRYRVENRTFWLSAPELPIQTEELPKGVEELLQTIRLTYEVTIVDTAPTP